MMTAYTPKWMVIELGEGDYIRVQRRVYVIDTTLSFKLYSNLYLPYIGSNLDGDCTLVDDRTAMPVLARACVLIPLLVFVLWTVYGWTVLALL